MFGKKPLLDAIKQKEERIESLLEKIEGIMKFHEMEKDHMRRSYEMTIETLRGEILFLRDQNESMLAKLGSPLNPWAAPEEPASSPLKQLKMDREAEDEPAAQESEIESITKRMAHWFGDQPFEEGDGGVAIDSLWGGVEVEEVDE